MIHTSRTRARADDPQRHCALLADLQALIDHHTHTPPPRIRPVSAAAGELQRHLQERRLRDRFFDPGLFADPAWDMLLDLWIARVSGSLVSVSSLCIASAVPPTTALRWIDRLSAGGYILRAPDPRDARRRYISLSPRGSGSLMRYFAAVAGTPA